MNARPRLVIGVTVLGIAVSCAGCSTIASPPDAVGDDYPGTCMPSEFLWPTDFLESLPGESSAVGGRIVGLRLEYANAEWAWRLRSVDTKYDLFGEQVDDPSFGKESLVDVKTMETLATHPVELTPAEQQEEGIGVYEAAQRSGEQWPSPLIIEMARVVESGAPVWRITTCDTETNEQSVMTLN